MKQKSILRFGEEEVIITLIAFLKKVENNKGKLITFMITGT